MLAALRPRAHHKENENEKSKGYSNHDYTHKVYTSNLLHHGADATDHAHHDLWFLMTPIEAFDLALELAISAPTQEKTEQATKLAEEIAMQLTPEQVEEVKSKYEMGEYK